MLNNTKDFKLYYSIKEVAAMFGLKETLLRYWETVFPNIRPQKSKGGARQYTKENIKELRMVVHLVKERHMTLQGARETMRHNKANTDKQFELIERLTSVRNELQAIGREMGSLE